MPRFQFHRNRTNHKNAPVTKVGVQHDAGDVRPPRQHQPVFEVRVEAEQRRRDADDDDKVAHGSVETVHILAAEGGGEVALGVGDAHLSVEFGENVSICLFGSNEIYSYQKRRVDH